MLKSAITLTMLAGFMNGSYAVPMKYIKHWSDENIWLVFSPIAFVIIPWISLLSLDSQVIPFLEQIPFNLFITLILGGFLFGIGMAVFTFSLRFVGFGISFMLNISSSTIIATLLPIILMEPKKLFSWFGAAEILSLVLFCIAIITAYFASLYKSVKISEKQNSPSKSFASIGIILGIISGILTSAQGFAYAYATTKMNNQLLYFSNMTITTTPWLLIFSAAFVPYFFYFLLKNRQNKTLKNIFLPKYAWYYSICIIMGVFYFGSLMVFAKASLSLGNMGVVVAWPMLMIFIILTSNFWSFIYLEWKGADKMAFRYLSLSLLTLIAAIFSLSLAGYLT